MKKIGGPLFILLFVVIGGYSQIAKPKPTVTIGGQVWDTKNLDVTTFANGDKIDQIQSNEEWVKAANEKRPGWCYYGNDPKNGAKFGILYNWFAVSDPRGLAPKGWHVPTKYEWLPMLDLIGGKDIAGRKLKSKTGWEAVAGTDRNGIDSIGFNVIPAGLRFRADGNFDAVGTSCRYWTATENESVRSALVTFGIAAAVQTGIADKGFGYSVRVVKD